MCTSLLMASASCSCSSSSPLVCGRVCSRSDARGDEEDADRHTDRGSFILIDMIDVALRGSNTIIIHQHHLTSDFIILSVCVCVCVCVTASLDYKHWSTWQQQLWWDSSVQRKPLMSLLLAMMNMRMPLSDKK